MTETLSDHGPAPPASSVSLPAFVKSVRDIDAALLAGADRHRLLLQILESTLQLVGADAGEVFVLIEDRFEPAAWSGLASPPTYSVPRDGGITGRAAMEQRTVAVDDYAFEGPADAGPDAKATAAAEGLRSIAAVPLLDGSDVVGVLNLARRRVQPFSVEELTVAEALAGQAVVVLRVAGLMASERRAARTATDATRAKSEFLANMSHELRTPLNAVLGFCDLLVEQLGPQLSSAQRRYFQNIKDAGDHLLGLINGVLDLSKVEAGRLELHPEPIQLAALFGPVLASAREEATARGLAFEAHVPRETTVCVDPGRMRQVLYNLLSNAVKFTPPGGGVEVRTSTDGRDLLLEVADTGIGIPLDRRDRVFGTFERLHEGRSDATGTGLGLALTKKLVELHRGAITFDSEEGRGTTFRVRVPEATFAPVAGPRLLIVEDDLRDAELLTALAGQVGVSAEVVGTARAAREAVQRDQPAGIVVDLRLPDERGERLIEEIKADPATRGIPVLVVTVEDDEGRSRPLGADDHLTKPIDRERVSSWIRSRVGVPRGTRAQSERTTSLGSMGSRRT